MSKSKFTQTQKDSIAKFNQLVESGSLSFEEKDCPCGHSEFREISKIERHGLRQRTVLCKNCGLMMSNPCLTNESFQFFYSTDIYRTLYEQPNYVELAKTLLSNNHCKYLFNDLSPLLKGNTNLNVLEFGCGGGWNLIHFSKAGYKVVGYDYSPNLTSVGRTYGLDLREGTIGDIVGEYDVIIMNHVIEHFTDLLGSMRAIIKHLKPGGIIYAGVPNMDNYGFEQLQNAHVYYFTPQTFKFYMGCCGLKSIKFGPAQEIHMYGVFELGGQAPNIFTLKSESKRLWRITRRAQIKERLGKILDKMGLKKLIKSWLKNFLL